MKISVCIDALFNGLDFIDSMKKLHNSNSNSFEFWSWWDKDIDAIAKAKQEMDMTVTAFCTKFVSLTDDAKIEEYINGLKQSIEVAKRLDCHMLISQVGDEIAGVSRDVQHRNIVNGLKACIPYLKKENMTLVIEPLNVLVDHMGYYLSSSQEAFDIVNEVNSSNVKVLYDIYHQQITEGNIVASITASIKNIGHFHGAGSNGRHELLNGELNYSNIMKVIDDLKFDGYLGLEYFPVHDPIKGIQEII